MASSFETRESAKERNENKAVSTKSHTGNLDAMTWDKAALKAEVMNYEDGKTVIWSELARKYKVTNANGEIAGNGGQTIKEWLIQEGVNVTRFKRPYEQSADSERIRRKKRKGNGGEISVPADVSPEQLRKMAWEKIESGEYTIGDRIVPRKVRNTCNITKSLQT